MEQHDVGTPGSMPPASWTWQQQQAVSGPGQGLSAEALQQYLLNPAALFQRQLEGSHNANLLQTMGAQLLLPSLAVAQGNLNHGHQGQVGPSGSGGPEAADSLPSNIDEIPGEDKAARRQRKLQEKNRRAQKRFRDRQKVKYQESQMIVDDLTSKVNRLTITVTNLEHSTTVLEKVVKIKDEIIAKLQTNQQQESGSREHDVLQADMVAFQQLLGGTKEAQESPKSWTAEGIRGYHKEYVAALSDCLVEGVEDPQSGAHRRLTSLVVAARTLAKTMALVDPQLVSWWRAVLPHPPALGEPDLDWPRAGLWKKVLGVMRLTIEQRAELLEQRRILLSHLSEVARQRQDIINALQGTLPLPSMAAGYMPLAPHTLAQQLRTNLEAEQRAHHNFLNNCFSKTLDAVQEARAQVAAYPQQPDMLAIADLIQEEESMMLANSNGMHPAHPMAPMTDGASVSVEGTEGMM